MIKLIRKYCHDRKEHQGTIIIVFFYKYPTIIDCGFLCEITSLSD